MESGRNTLPSIGVADTIGLVMSVVMPTFAKGVIIRRPRMVGLAEALGLDRKAVERLQRLRVKYGPGPHMLSIAGRKYAVVVEAEHVHRILDGAPKPFAPASDEKRSALAHFEPMVSLASRSEERSVRRQLNEEVLESGCPVHHLAPHFRRIVQQETGQLLERGESRLHYDSFVAAWNRTVRSIILGGQARDDDELTSLLNQLRDNGNWAFLARPRKAQIDELHRRLAAHVDCSHPESIAGLMRSSGRTPLEAPTHQLAHHLFAFDAAAIATFRALALLAAHPRQMARAEREADCDTEGLLLPFLRACVLESLRLWPTTPAILRQTLEDTAWDGGVMPKETGILIFAPYFHRDGQKFDYADVFAPDIWLGGEELGEGSRALIPFSAGPARCPGREVVESTCAMVLAGILGRCQVELDPPRRLDRHERMPGTLSPFSLHFLLKKRR